MKKLLPLMLVCIPVILLAHKVYQKEMAEILADSDLVMTAKVTKAKTTRHTCETDYEFQLAPGNILKGTCTQKNISFHYSVHFWNEEKGCPGVHYILPPVPHNLAKGLTVIAAFKKQEGPGGDYRGTGIFDLGEMDAVMKLIKK